MKQLTEVQMMDDIAKNALKEDALNQNTWHCGTAHCMAGWCQVLFDSKWRKAARLYKEGHRDLIRDGDDVYLSEVYANDLTTLEFAQKMLPTFHTLVNVETEVMSEFLTHRAYALKDGEVVRTGMGWMNNQCNTSSHMRENHALDELATNRDCVSCHDCRDCYRCNKCVDCVNCIKLWQGENAHDITCQHHGQ